MERPLTRPKRMETEIDPISEVHSHHSVSACLRRDGLIGLSFQEEDLPPAFVDGMSDLAHIRCIPMTRKAAEALVVVLQRLFDEI